MPNKKKTSHECTFEIEQAILQHNQERVKYINSLLTSLECVQSRIEREYKLDSTIHDRLKVLSESLVSVLEEEVKKL